MHYKILFVFIWITIFSHSQAVRIGKYVVSTEDLNVTHFNNGDEIPVFNVTRFNNGERETDVMEVEAIKYSKLGKPACIKVGNSVWYNWYATNDKRGIAPSGWYIPEWRQFEAYGETVRIHYMKNGFRKNKFPGRPTSKYNDIDIYNWWVGGEMKEFADPIVQIWTNRSSTNLWHVKKEEFYPVRLFAKDPELVIAPIYFTQEKEFKIDVDSLDWNIRIESQDCDWGNEVNDCFGQAKIYLTNKKDKSKIYTIHVDDFNFSWDKKDKIISNLGLVFDDFNFDGQNDFGYGFDGDMFDGLLPKVYLMSQDGIRFEYNKEFNKLILGGEYSWYDLSKRTFDFVSTIGIGNEHAMTYYLCPKDSLKKFNNYLLTEELQGYKINYPNVYLVKYYNKSDSEVEKFDFFNHVPFTKKTLTEIEKGEFDESYIFNFENSTIYNRVDKIDSATFYKAYENVVPNPFLLKEKATLSELKLIKKNKSSVSKKRDNLTIDCSEGQIRSFDSGEEAAFNYRFYGETENQRHWLVNFSENGSCASGRVLLIDKKTCEMDTISGFTRYSPDGKLAVIGEYVEEEGAFGFLELYKIENDKISEIGSVLMDDLQYSFAPYELFWVDNKTLYVKKLKTKGFGENDYYFEYGKITIDYFNKLK
jgi:hypothetical protein